MLADITPFIADMAEAFAWADLVVCRAGASTLAELCAVGVGSVLVPFPLPSTITRPAMRSIWSSAVLRFC